MSTFLITLILILIILLFVVYVMLHANALLSYFIGGAPFLPTPLTVMETMLELAEIRPDELVYDLGCGDGRLLIEANYTYKARAVGVDISPFFCWIARIKARLCNAEITIIQADMMKIDFSNADVLFCYLMPAQMEKLETKFLQLKKGCRIISLRFEMPNWEPACRVDRKDSIHQPAIFKYQI